MWTGYAHSLFPLDSARRFVGQVVVDAGDLGNRHEALAPFGAAVHPASRRSPLSCHPRTGSAAGQSNRAIPPRPAGSGSPETARLLYRSRIRETSARTIASAARSSSSRPWVIPDAKTCWCCQRFAACHARDHAVHADSAVHQFRRFILQPGSLRRERINGQHGRVAALNRPARRPNEPAPDTRPA